MDLDRLLRVIVEYNQQDDVFYNVINDRVVFLAMCSDFFAYASADGEYIACDEDIDLYEQCCKDLAAIKTDKYNTLMWVGPLYATRVRKEGMIQQRSKQIADASSVNFKLWELFEDARS